MKITKEIKADLAKAYQCAMEISILDMKAPIRYINQYIAEDVIGFGTAADEKVKSRDDYKKMVLDARRQAKGMLFKARITTPYRPKFIDETIAQFRDEMIVEIGDKKNKHSIHLWFSTLFKYQHNKWQMVMFHGSMPDTGSSSADTFHVSEAEKKLKELEQVVAQRTADLQTKNRELEIEAALERVRSRSLAVHASVEFNEVIKVVFKNLRDLGMKAGSVSINTFIENSNDNQVYISDGNHVINYLLPYFENPISKDRINAKAKQLEFFSKTYNKEEKDSFYKILLTNSGLKHVPDEIKKIIRSSTLYTMSYSVARHSMIVVNDFTGNVLSKDNIEILKRFSKVFEQSYIRFLDLQKAEAQAREAQIEAALERVRSRTMAMQASEELNTLIGTVFTELTRLDLVLTRCAILIYDGDEKKKGLRQWMINSETPSMPMSFYIKPSGLPYFNALRKGWSERSLHWQYELKGKNKLRTDEFLFKETELCRLPDFVITAMRDPERIYISASFNNFGCIILASMEPLSKEHFDILLRFAKVFDLTYTRFNDLKQAEAQAREAKIEAALERVRGRAMAMHASNELKEVAKEMRNQLHLLGQKELETCAIHLWDEPSGQFEAWAALRSPDNTGKIIESESKLKIKGIRILEENFQLYSDGKKDYVLINDVAKAKEFFEALKPVDPKAYSFLSPTIKNKKPQDISAYWSVSDFTGGSLVMVTMNPPEENSRAILRRFADVFGLAYRRFSDLQKAEAQAREARIEAALERVRSRSMAMHKSEELKQVIRVVLDQFVHLNINVGHAGFYIDYKVHDDMHIWLADPKLEPFYAVIPYFDTPTWNSFLEAKTKGITLHSDLLEFKTKNKFYTSLFKLFEIPEEAKEFYLQCKGLAVSTILLDSVGLYIENFDGTPYTDEENNILLRFGNVFQQAYTRFLDLQKAEAQAREAEIQLALERVRARTMAMQQSEELLEVINIFSDQLVKLNINFDNVSFGVNEQADDFKFWLSSAGQPHPIQIQVPYFDNPAPNRVIEAQKKGLKFFADILTPEENKRWVQHLINHSELRSLPDKVKNYLLTSSGFARSTFVLKNINLYIGNYQNNPYTEEENNIFKRFAQAFEQSYTRFLDLQKAEAQAKEAQIEAALERVRARTMAMQKSTELNATADLLFEQLRHLGAELQGVAFAICDRDSNIVQKWTSIGVFSFPYTVEPAEQNMYKAWKNKVPLYEEVFEGERIKKYYKTLMEVPAFKQGLLKLLDAGVPMPTWQKNHAVSFQQGYLLIITTKPFAETQIFVRFGKVFEQTYTRFLDLQKAEAQAKEAQIEAALERVRSRTMAMQSSNELQETAAVLFEEFKKLGSEEIYQVTIGIYNEEERLIDFRVTDWAGSGQQDQRTFQLDMNEPTLLQPANAAWKEGKKSAVFDLTGERLQGWLNYRNRISGITMRSQDTSGRRVISVAYFSKGHLSLSSPSPLGEETIKTLERFANVFDGTYTRFLDLEKAEAQAREAKIEAALEKVRSRTLAMQKSDELAETAAVLFQQLITLGIAPNRLYIIIMKADSPELEAWVTDEDGSKVRLGFTANYQNNPSIKKMYEGWQQQKKSLVVDMQGKELQQYFHYLHHDLKVPFKGGLEQKRRLQYLAYFSHGLIGMASPDEQPAETLQLLERFAAVFNLTFTRFNDLKIAEAHAIQAEQDLIAIKEAKQKVEEALMELQSTQKQLIQSEKMASLGELTAGIAHEIQNPLNFVNNFSEVSNELMEELRIRNEELRIDDPEVKGLLNDIGQNLEKINHHGKRAGDIVKGMLQHSRTSTGQKEMTDINALCDEYLRLSYHGLRAKDKSFNAKFETDFDPSLPKMNVVPQEIGRVILNLINNAFYATNERKKLNESGYEPEVIVSTRKEKDKVEIKVKDNGTGIQKNVVDKIFQPFFTTKPTGSGTGLGLSLSYDIVKAHGGEIKVESKEGEGTEFVIQLGV